MLVIKKAQIQQFIAEDNTQLIRVISEIIREAFFDTIKDYSDETLESMVKIGIKRAETYGFERAESIASFVAMMFEVSPKFDSSEGVQTVLSDTSITEENKFDQLFGRTDEDVWIEAEKTYDPKDWFPEDTDTAK